MRHISFHGQSDLGRLRTNNEDAYVVQYIWDKNHILAIVIDGVGGYEGGEVAASIASSTIVQYLERYTNGERKELLAQAVIYANNAIFQERNNRPELANMSCVLTAILIEIEQQRINMAHVGDTRLYILSNNELTKLSHDHSLIGFREELGELTEEEAMRHPQRNIISRDVGSVMLSDNTDNYVETSVFALPSKSTILLCSDGLYDMITSTTIREVLERNESVELKTKALIAEANAVGGKDNITAIAIDIQLDANMQSTTRNSAKYHTYYIETHTESSSKDAVNSTVASTPAKTKKRRCVIIVLAAIFLTIIGYYFFIHKSTHKAQVGVVEQTTSDTIRIDSISQDTTTTPTNIPCKAQ